MKNNNESQSAEATKKIGSEAPAVKEADPKARMKSEALPQHAHSSPAEGTRARQESQRRANDLHGGAAERRSTTKATVSSIEARIGTSRPRESLLGQNNATDMDSAVRGRSMREGQAGPRASERTVAEHPDQPMKGPREALKPGQNAEQKIGQQTDGNADHKDSSRLIKPGEQLKVQGSDATVSKKAWENPGSFVVSNPDARTTRIEGFISPQPADRTSAEGKLQKEAATRGGTPEQEQKWAGGHRIADVLGGPRVATHGREITVANLEPSDSRINGSMIKVFEMAMLHEMRRSPDKKLFMQADTRVDPNGKQWVTHRVFEVGKDGMPKGRPVKETQTREDLRPSMTVGQAVEGSVGGPAEVFHSTRTGGAHRSRHGDH